MPGRMSRRAWWISIVLGAILLGLFVPPFVNVNRYRNRVAASIGKALGREVTVSNIELRLLPRPAMVLSTFVVADDPSYGAGTDAARRYRHRLPSAEFTVARASGNRHACRWRIPA